MMDQRSWSVEQAAQWLGIATTTVYRLVKRGQLPGFKVGGRWRFRRERLAEWAADREMVARLRAEQREPQPEDRAVERAR